MLKPESSKRDWYLFHMTPAGLGQKHEKTADNWADSAKAKVLLGGVIALALLIAAAANL